MILNQERETVTRGIQRIRTLDQIRRYLKVDRAAGLQTDRRESIYAFIRQTLERFEYHRLRKADKGLIKAFLAKATGFSRAQLTRLIAQHRATGTIRDHRSRPRGSGRDKPTARSGDAEPASGDRAGKSQMPPEETRMA